MSGNLLPANSRRSLAGGATQRLSGDDGPLPGRRDIHIRLQNRALINLLRAILQRIRGHGTGG
ncbi:hypothetical protein TN98_10780 [Pantoea anthophila]|nr:hypothetical protein TN98_10780 [Pantoea anthophila]